MDQVHDVATQVLVHSLAVNTILGLCSILRLEAVGPVDGHTGFHERQAHAARFGVGGEGNSLVIPVGPELQSVFTVLCDDVPFAVSDLEAPPVNTEDRPTIFVANVGDSIDATGKASEHDNPTVLLAFFEEHLE